MFVFVFVFVCERFVCLCAVCIIFMVLPSLSSLLRCVVTLVKISGRRRATRAKSRDYGSSLVSIRERISEASAVGGRTKEGGNARSPGIIVI